MLFLATFFTAVLWISGLDFVWALVAGLAFAEMLTTKAF